MVKYIELTQGKRATVDDEDYEYLTQWKWFAAKNGQTYYAARTTPRDRNGKQQRVYMHRELVETEGSHKVDHKNGNGLDNRRDNLRIASQLQNMRNQRAKSTNTSGYKGVRWHKGNKRWFAEIRVDGKKVHVGSFDNKIEAAKAYNKAAKSYFGEFARLNHIPE